MKVEKVIKTTSRFKQGNKNTNYKMIREYNKKIGKNDKNLMRRIMDCEMNALLSDWNVHYCTNDKIVFV